jgi:hypothetical protein
VIGALKGLRMVPRVLEFCTGWLLVSIIAVAPFLFGGVTEGAVSTLNKLLGLSSLFWLLHLLVDQRWPRVRKPVLLAVVWLFIQGWAMALNAEGFFDPEFIFYSPATETFGFWPSTLDGVGAKAVMWRLTVLLPALLAMTDLCHQTRWVSRFLRVMAATGIAIAAFGIWQKAALNPLQVWPMQAVPPHAFATFWYHGNAAALLNIAWPLALAGVVWTFVQEGSQVSRAIWLLGWLVILVGLAVNVSKAGHALAVLLSAAILLLLGLRVRTLISQYGWRHLLIAGLLILGSLIWLLTQPEVAVGVERWEQFLAREQPDSRVTVSGECLEMAGSRPVLGYGPGSFMAAYHLRQLQGEQKIGAIWQYAHNDVLQGLVEWGFLGFIAWGVIWGSGLIGAATTLWSAIRPAFVEAPRRSRRSRERWRKSFEAMRKVHLLGASFSLVGLMLHACMDFPLQIYSLQIHAVCLVAMLTVPKEPSIHSDWERYPENTESERDPSIDLLAHDRLPPQTQKTQIPQFGNKLAE